jgi:hypothetical protein
MRDRKWLLHDTEKDMCEGAREKMSFGDFYFPTAFKIRRKQDIREKNILKPGKAFLDTAPMRINPYKKSMSTAAIRNYRR